MPRPSSLARAFLRSLDACIGWALAVCVVTTIALTARGHWFAAAVVAGAGLFVVVVMVLDGTRGLDDETRWNP